jgi:DNA-binding MarR family transcriptional regulator
MIHVSWMIYIKFIFAANMTIDVAMRYKLEDMGGERGCAPGSAVLLSRLAKQVYRRSDELGMQLRHVVALSYVLDHDACPQQDLANAFCMDANNVVLLLNELEQLDYVTRLRDPHDRRRHVVQLTAAGRKALHEAERGQKAIEDEVLGALDEQERRTLRELLRRALRGVEPADGASAEGDGYSATVASIST